MSAPVEVWIPGLDPADDDMLEANRAACEKLPEVPAHILTWAICDARSGDTARAKRELFAWADSKKIVRSRKTHAPLLWLLYQDGWRCIGMPDSEPSWTAKDVACIGGDDLYCAHYDEALLIDFWNGGTHASYAESWKCFAHLPKFDRNIFSELLRRTKQETGV